LGLQGLEHRIRSEPVTSTARPADTAAFETPLAGFSEGGRMTDVDLDAERYEKHREAGEILVEVMSEARGRVEVGASLLEVAEAADARIE
jgi:hypothetical protein